MPEPTAAELQIQEKRYVWFLAIFAALLALIPFVSALANAPPGSTYLGFEYNTDDHMVYSAWMRQAMDGRFFFDNRFTTDAQPGLTVHLYFFVLGLIAKLTGIAWAATLARVGFSILFVFLLHNLVRRFSPNLYVTKLAMTLAIFGGGLGFAVWHNFGVAIVKEGPGAAVMKGVTGGGLPTDVWQPESFVFPSMLTNSLFMVSLCLILYTFRCVLDARDSWKPVLPGAIAFGVLMNVHSYDVLLVALVLVGFLVMSAVRGQAKGIWIARSAAIMAGVIPAALWFVHVLQSDAVFQARAATPTFSPNFRTVFGAFLLLMAFAIPAWILRLRKEEGEQTWFVRREAFKATAYSVKQARAMGAGLSAALILAVYALATKPYDAGAEYFIGMGVWAAIYVGTLVALALLADEQPAWNLVTAWALVGLMAPYFPALFQRKLAMGLSIPWALLAAVGLSLATRKLARSERNLTTVLVLILFSGSSIMWLFVRELGLIRNNVSNTTVHAPFLNGDAHQIVDYLNANRGVRTVVVAMPGVPNPKRDSQGQIIPDQYDSPAMPDLNPILSGMTGVYTFAGHWSETPDYERRRADVTAIFLASTPADQRAILLVQSEAQYIVAPVPEAFKTTFANSDGQSVLADLTGLGEVVVDGDRFRLIRLR